SSAVRAHVLDVRSDARRARAQRRSARVARGRAAGGASEVRRARGLGARGGALGAELEGAFPTRRAKRFGACLDSCLFAAIAGLVELLPRELVGQIGLAGHDSPFEVVSVSIPFAVTFVLHQLRHGVAQLLRDGERSTLRDALSRPLPCIL